jgi:protein-tyrosine phosphatase
VGQWIARMQGCGIRRVVCLLPEEQLAYYKPLNLLAEYRKAFGDGNVRSEPVRDYHLCEPARLSRILVFLKESASGEAPVVVHCSGGSGRTGHVLAAWLVHQHELAPEDALKAVIRTGRNPWEAVQMGNATEDDLLQLLKACSRSSVK